MTGVELQLNAPIATIDIGACRIIEIRSIDSVMWDNGVMVGVTSAGAKCSHGNIVPMEVRVDNKNYTITIDYTGDIITIASPTDMPRLNVKAVYHED